MRKTTWLILTLLFLLASGTLAQFGGSSGGGNGTATQFSITAFANLATPPSSGVRYCSNCNAVNPCTTGGTGAFAFRVGSQWNCAGTGTASPLSNALTNTHIFVGNSSNIATDVALSGDATLANTGALTLVSTITAGGPTGSATVAPIITYDAKGRLTTVSSATITPAVGSITGLGTGVATALGVNVGSAGAFLTFNGAGGTPSSITLTNGTGLPLSTGVTGTLQAAQEPAHTGDVTNSAGSLALSIASNAVTLAKLATQATNTVLGNATSGTAVPTALPIGTCSTAGSALIWTTNSGFGCNTSITAAAVPASGLTGATLASGVTASSLTSLGTITTLTATTINAFTLGGTISGGGNQINNVIIGTTTPLAGNFTTVAGSGNMTTSAGDGGFGTASPNLLATSHAVTVNGSAGAAVELAIGGVLKGYFFTNGTATSIDGQAGYLAFNAGSAERVRFAANGTVLMPGLGTSSAATTGTVCWTTGTGLLNVDTTTTCLLSGEQFKESARKYNLGLDAVMKLQPRSYFLKPEYNPTGLSEQVGFFAGEVAKVDPRLVSFEADGTPHAVRYQQMSALFASAIQELNAKVDAQQKEIDALKAK